MKVSIVIPTYRREHLLRRCLDSLIVQRFPHEEYEIIVADDANSIETRNLVDKYSRENLFLKFKYVAVYVNHGPAAARNAGWKISEGEIIAFTDDDCLARPNWLEEGIAAFERNTAAVSGKVSVPIPPLPNDHELCISWMQDCRFLTANSFYRKKVLEDIGGFDERFKAAWREDSDLYFNVIKKGLPVKFIPDAVVVHPVRKLAWGFGLGEEKKNFYNALLYKKHKDLFRNKVESSPPWHYYAAAGCAALGFLGGIILPFLRILILAWILITLDFAEKRLRNTSKTPLHILEIIFTSFAIPFLSIFWRLAGAINFKVLYF